MPPIGVNPKLACIPPLVIPKSSTIGNSTDRCAVNRTTYPKRMFLKLTGFCVKIVWMFYVKFGKDLVTYFDPDQTGRWQNMLESENVVSIRKRPISKFQRLSSYVENECFMKENEYFDYSNRVWETMNVLDIFMVPQCHL